MTRVWAWIAAAFAAIAGIVGLSAWWRGRAQGRALRVSAADLAKANAKRARELAQASLDDAVRRGEDAAAEADRVAAEEVINGTDNDDFVGYLRSVDPGPD